MDATSSRMHALNGTCGYLCPIITSLRSDHYIITAQSLLHGWLVGLVVFGSIGDSIVAFAKDVLFLDGNVYLLKALMAIAEGTDLEIAAVRSIDVTGVEKLLPMLYRAAGVAFIQAGSLSSSSSISLSKPLTVAASIASPPSTSSSSSQPPVVSSFSSANGPASSSLSVLRRLLSSVHAVPPPVQMPAALVTVPPSKHVAFSVPAVVGVDVSYLC